MAWVFWSGITKKARIHVLSWPPKGKDCGCNVEVDGYIYAATSIDGKKWKVEGEVSGVYNGAENYPDAFVYHNNKYYLISHRAQGGDDNSLSISSGDYLNFKGQGKGKLNFGLGTRWKGRGAYLHNDNTVTLPYQRNSKDVRFLTMRLSNDLKKFLAIKKFIVQNINQMIITS